MKLSKTGILLVVAISALGLLVYFSDSIRTKTIAETPVITKKTNEVKEETKKEETTDKPFHPKDKTDEQKQAVMDADLAVMDSYNLYYDYKNLSLVETIKAFLDEYGIDHSSVAVSYKNPATGEVIGFNETQPMIAGSTYKLPLSMLITDGIADKKFSLTEKYNITEIDYENEAEYLAYVQEFGESMSIADMQRYALVYSENTPAHAMAQMIGGFSQMHKLFETYGKSKNPDIPTFSSYNTTTTDYYIQVLDHLFKNSDKYADILNYIGESFPNQYYKGYLNHLTIQQKPGYIGDTLNVAAIVHEESPYLAAVYTTGLGDGNNKPDEVNPLGYSQLVSLCYVINEWHRVNQNP